MPIHGYPGNIITANPTEPSQTSASGVWTAEQQLQYQNAGKWPPPYYLISRSLRFNSADSAYLNRTNGSPTSATTWTLSFWHKRSSGLGTQQNIMGAGQSSGTNYSAILFTSANQFEFNELASGVNLQLTPTQVFRDVSAWYHIIIAVDTTQATASNRIKLYVNGSQITAFTNATYPSQNYATYFNTNAYIKAIGNIWYNGGPGGYYLNGYLTEINFIDGQALTPSSFGQNNSQTGIWEPIRYTGTYGTNGFYLPMNAGSTWSGFFDGSNDYLSVASNAAWQYGTGDFTVECWLLGTSSGALSNQYPLGRYNTSAGAYGALQIGNSTTIYWYYANGGAYSFTLGTALTTNRWYHFAVSRSGTSLRFFLDGTQIGSTQTDSTNYSGTAEFRIVNAHQSSATYFPGYISNVRVVKGSAVYTANFTPSTTPLTAITNTVLLTCQSSTFIDNSTNNFTITNNGGALNQLISPFAPDVVDDASGNGNNWQPNNLDLRTTGVGGDIMVDVPTNYGSDTGAGGEVRGNYCTLNPLTTTAGTYTQGNLRYVGATGWRRSNATIPLSTGKWYWEVTLGTAPYSPRSTSTSYNAFGFGLSTVFNSTSDPTAATDAVYLADNGWYKNFSGSWTDGGTAFSNGDTLAVAVDLGANTFTFYRNNTQITTGTIGGTAGRELVPIILSYDGTYGVMDCNFGQRPFAYTAPSGFKALCTQNLPTPTIGATSTTQAGKYFDATLWTGNGTTQSITNSGGMQPDFLWVKSRSGTTANWLVNAVTGAGNGLISNSTAAEQSLGIVTSLDSSGFSVSTIGGTNLTTNGNAATFVGWQWKANGAGVTNTAGSITSTVSVNATAGFSIVTYTGNNSTATIGHGLGVAPSMIIIKDRLQGTGYNWNVYHASIGNTQRLYLDATSAATTGVWNNTSPTSTVFTVINNAAVNGTDNYVAYCWTPIAGYSAFGSYAGNGSTDGPFVYTGFRPRWILIKNSSAAASWYIYDAVRNTFNVVDKLLYPNLSNAEDTYTFGDILSNGFKIRSTDSGMNGNGNTIIYAAFAESPFKYALAR